MPLIKLNATQGLTGTLPAVSGANLTNIGGGITEADMFRLTADVTSTGYITSNLERCDDESFAKIGTGMTESSGLFSFPTTGIYRVTAFMNAVAIPDDNVGMIISVTINNSNFDDTGVFQASGDGSTGASLSGSTECLIDVTDVSNVKVKFYADSINSGSRIVGHTQGNNTFFTFIRLGDT